MSPIDACIALSVLGLIAVSSYFLFFRSYLRRKQLNVPAVKGGLPIIGQVGALLKGSPWNVMADWSKTYGSIFTFHMFGNDPVVISDPELLKIVLQTKLTTFNKDLDWTYAPFLDILGNGLVTSHGESWRKQRTLLSHTLRIDILDEIPLMAIKAFKRLAIKLDKCCVEKSVIEMASEFRHLTLQVIAEAVLSIPPEESDQTFAHMYLPIVDEGNMRIWHPERKYIPNPSWWNYPSAVKKLNKYVTGIIRRRWSLIQQESASNAKDKNNTSQHRRQDILDKILSAISPSEWNDAAVSQVCDEVKTFILAGHETSASMLTWALYELSRNATHLDKLQQEVDKVFYNDDHFLSKSSIEIDDIPKRDEYNSLVYAEACLRESLRLYAIVPSVVRVCSSDILLADQHFLAKGTSVIVNIQGVHHNEKYWPNHKTYTPDRFLRELEPYTFLAFAEGPRMCLGRYVCVCNVYD